MNELNKLILALLLFFTTNCFSQTHEPKVLHHSMNGSHRITLGLGQTSVSEGETDGETKWLAMASWSLNYDYWISNK